MQDKTKSQDQTAGPVLISAEKLCELTGLIDRRHRQLAHAGYFPEPVQSQYKLVPTIQGLFRFYREQHIDGRKSLLELKEEKLKNENRKLMLENLRLEGKMVEMDRVNEFILNLATAQKLRLYQSLEKEAPARLVGKSLPELARTGREIADEICGIMTEKHDQWLRLKDQP